MSKFIDYDASAQLDSSNAFEGPEKLLEIWISPDKDCLPVGMPSNGLRAVSRARWQQVLNHVCCTILSTMHTAEIDAFVLSESSMFVYPHKLILKTCGTTTLLAGVPAMLDLFADELGFPRGKQPWRVFYSRKTFMFPENQKAPHKSWKDEVQFLDAHFEHGAAYTVGNVNSDHWYLYTTVPRFFDYELRSTVRGVNLPTKTRTHDETLEILMTDLSPFRAANFFSTRLPRKLDDDDARSDDVVEDTSSLESSFSSLYAPADNDDPGHELGNEMTRVAKIDQIYPVANQMIDAFAFRPCGYSCNGLVSESNYFTVHVTPERGFSYASFESNIRPTEYGLKDFDVIERVINIFKPGKFSVTLFANKPDELLVRAQGFCRMANYRRTEKILYELNGYDLVFMSFEHLVY